MTRTPKSRARLGLMTFHALFEPEIEHVIEFEQTAELIIYTDTSEPLGRSLVWPPPLLAELGGSPAVGGEDSA